MTYARRVDGSHAEVRDTLRRLGFTVEDTSRFGGGFPDLIACRCGRLYFVEVKTARGKLRASQVEFKQRWRDHYFVLRSTADVLRWAGVTERP